MRVLSPSQVPAELAGGPIGDGFASCAGMVNVCYLTRSNLGLSPTW